MDFLSMLEHRRSIRQYTGEPIPEEKLKQVLQAGLLSVSGRTRQPWELIVVRDRETLTKLSQCRPAGAGMLAQADCAVVVVADPEKTDVWTEDCSILMSNMHLMADHLGLGSCWIQGRLRPSPDGGTAEDVVRSLLHFPESYRLEAILSLGMPAQHPKPHKREDIPTEKIHWEKF
jgi:nitroreductase